MTTGTKSFAVGIDLGTSNTVVGYAPPGSADIRLLEIPQWSTPGELQASPLLPSLRFHPAPGELPSDHLGLPWSGKPYAMPDPVPDAVTGLLARRLGSQVPGRLVASAKSWLSHPSVDRLAPILPWGAPDEVPKISPVDASSSYLAHVRAAWNQRFPGDPLEHQQVMLTVPASFDESARALTVEAAFRAGLPRVRLLEEPQAAFHDWLFRHRDCIAEELAQTRLVLVCDVGGGTTDFSLIQVAVQDGSPQLTRIGIGKHLMLGGDNMDLVLAHLVESRLGNAAPGEGHAKRLSAARLSQLIERCRVAKELLLSEHPPERTTVTLLGGGSSLIGASRSAELTREEVEQAIVEGFFPIGAPTALPRPRRSGIVEFGLPYASDAAITRHLAAFLSRHADVCREALGIDGSQVDIPAIPDTLLLNGGVFHATALARRVEETLAKWRGTPLRRLHNHDPDTAVARGAAAYWLAREGTGLRIGGGSPRNLFLVLASEEETRQQARHAEDSASSHANSSAGQDTAPVRTGICILPRGTEEGHECTLANRLFALRVGQPVRFHLASSGAEMAPKLGEIVALDEGRFDYLPPLATALPPRQSARTASVPVRLATMLTEVGTLQVECVADQSRYERWRLEFELRQHACDGGAQHKASASFASAQAFSGAIAQIDRLFGTRRQRVDSKEVRQLRMRLEKILGSREAWTMPVLRQLADALLHRAKGRRRSADHERVWLNLVGYCLRPGFGFPLDDWRSAQLWAMFESGVQYRNDLQVRTQWWTMWRRVAGGLDRDAQLRLLDDFAWNTQSGEAMQETEPEERPPGLVTGTEEDMLRLVATLERIPAAYKTEIGDWLLERLAPGPASRSKKIPADASETRLWTLARLGARQPFHGSLHDTVPPDVAERWLAHLLALDWKHHPSAAFAAAHVARLTGDRTRDVGTVCREAVAARLITVAGGAAWSRLVMELTALDAANTEQFLGDSLPPGLSLIH